MIDFRSDTVTKPTEAMRHAISHAEVGDDVYIEDITALKLEQKLASMAGKEAGLFFPSGTQSNLTAILCHCGRGEEYIVGNHYHTFKYEAGGTAVLGGIMPHAVEISQEGILPLEAIKAAIKPDDVHFPITRLLSLENTVNGRLIPQDYILKATNIMREKGLNCHLDGARLFNAHIKSGLSLAELTSPFDTTSICLSKGLGAPIGSVLVGSQELINRARRWRKMLGGGMRQIGVLASAGLYALDHHIERLQEDHDNAAFFAEALTHISGLDISVEYTGTNMFFITFHDEKQLDMIREKLTTDNIFIASDKPQLRFVTHLDISKKDIDFTLKCIKTAV